MDVRRGRLMKRKKEKPSTADVMKSIGECISATSNS
jgi:hypothetical protein